jgi:hypothetical protein
MIDSIGPIGPIDSIGCLLLASCFYFVRVDLKEKSAFENPRHPRSFYGSLERGWRGFSNADFKNYSSD